MVTKKHRSVFWVVSTHVLTTGFAMPMITYVIGVSVLTATKQSPVTAFLILLALRMLGYIGGAFYSLSYISKIALVEKPSRCIKPSIITFVVLASISYGVNVAGIVAQQPQKINPIAGIIGLLVFYAVICFAFARITQQGFLQMESQTTEADSSSS